MSLDSFFNPKSIAVVGVSADPTKLGAVVFNNIISAEYEGHLYGVNPKLDGQELCGKPCYASVDKLPEAMDLVVILVPARFTEATVDQCIAYALAKPCVPTVICGACTIDELLADLHYLHATDAEKDYNAALSGAGSQIGSGECSYCNHCAPCPHGIQIAKVNELLDKAEAAQAQGQPIPAEVQKAYNDLPHHASECTDCGTCKSRCPFDVDVPSRMHKAVEVFGK